MGRLFFAEFLMVGAGGFLGSGLRYTNPVDTLTTKDHNNQSWKAITFDLAYQEGDWPGLLLDGRGLNKSCSLNALHDLRIVFESLFEVQHRIRSIALFV